MNTEETHQAQMRLEALFFFVSTKLSLRYARQKHTQTLCIHYRLIAMN